MKTSLGHMGIEWYILNCLSITYGGIFFPLYFIIIIIIIIVIIIILMSSSSKLK